MSTLVFLICFFSYFFVVYRLRLRFDAYIFFYICSSIYFLPVLTGLVVDWQGVFSRNVFATPLSGDLVRVSWYLTFLYFYLTVVLLGFQLYSVRGGRDSLEMSVSFQGKSFFLILFAATVSLFFYLYFSGLVMKYDVAEAGGSPLFILYLSLSVITIGWGVLSNSKLVAVLTLLLAVLTLATGTRTPLAFYFFFLFLSFFFSNRESFVGYLLRRKWLGVGAVFGVSLVYISKYIYTYLNLFGLSGFALLYDSFFGDGFCLVCGFEPALQLSIFDLVYRNETLFSGVDLGRVFVSWLALFPVPLSLFGGDSSYVSEFVRAQALHGAGYSIAGNLLAESLLVFGFAGPLFFIPMWISLVALLNYGIRSSLRRRDPVLYLLCLIVLVNVCFFWHRYMLGSALGNIRNYIYIYILVLGFYSVLKLASAQGKVSK